MTRAIVVATALTVMLVPLATGAMAGLISATSIAGGKLGGTRAGYVKLLGAGAEEEVVRRNPAFVRLFSNTRRTSVYFKRKNGKAILITTWDKADRTAAGVGPCTPIATLKKVYGDRLKNSKHETYKSGVYAYRLGSLIFAATAPLGAGHPSKHVTAVGLYTDVTEATATDFTIALDQAAC